MDARRQRVVWGNVPAAGAGTRIQPLAFSKELLPVGSPGEDGTDRPRAVAEYLLERMTLAGADRIGFIVSPGKTDIVEYFAVGRSSAHLSFVVQPVPAGLCDAIFHAAPLVGAADWVLVGLPGTIWYPADALLALGDAPLSFLLFPVARPERFDAVLTDAAGRVRQIRVKSDDPGTEWIWGAFKLSGSNFHELHDLWLERERRDEFVGTLVNAWLARGGTAMGVRAGESYLDVGTLHGFREATAFVASRPALGEVAIR